MISDARKSVKDLVETANRHVKTFGQDEALELLGKDNVQFVDIRDIRELQRDGMIDGALHAPRGMLEFWIDPESPYHKPVFAEDKIFIFY
ncbi:MAG: rhodanese-like domain-containing protein, partial [Pseudomonadota bacterium]